jgi:transcriptional regulator with XRE-family HTH domain
MKILAGELAGIRNTRKDAGISLQFVAQQTGIDRARLSHFENGLAELSPEQFERVATVIMTALEAKAAKLSALVAIPEAK